MTSRFQSWLAPQLDRFIALKRAGGYQYTAQEAFVRRFDRYLSEHTPCPPLHRDALWKYVASLESLSPRGRDNVVSVVWQALRFARAHGSRIDPLPPRPPAVPPSFRVGAPRLVMVDDIRAVISVARHLPPTRKSTDAIRCATYATLFGLLFATGMRISEALSADIGDLDLDAGLFTVRRGKFGKTRVLPLKESTVAALARYVDDPRRRVGTHTTAPLFVSARARRLTYTTASKVFASLCVSAKVREPVPHLHHLRHSFSVLRVVAWYREGRDVNALLPALSTYLGHASVEATRVYLRQNGLLLEQACRLFSIKTAALDEVLP